MANKAPSLDFPLKKTTEISIRGIDGKGVWLGLKDDIDTGRIMDVVQFQKAVTDDHAWFYYNKEDRQLENVIDQWLPQGFYCQNGEVYDDGLYETAPANYWPLIVFLIIMFGGLLM